ncbi:MAG: hypothetical protein AB9903_14820 [Vulcanimicrobiota bacterium]
MRTGNLVLFKKKVDGKTEIIGALTLESGFGGTLDEIKTVLDGVKKAIKESDDNASVELLPASQVDLVPKDIPFFSFPAVIFYDREKIAFRNELFHLAAANIFSGYGRFFPALYTGGVVKGSDFFDRKEEIDMIAGLLRDGRNINLRAPRRFGKTSLMSYLVENPEKIATDMTPIYIDLERVGSPARFAATICVHVRRYINISSNLPCMHGKCEAELVDEIKRLADRWVDSWEKDMQEIFEAAERSEKTFLFLLDEITLMLDFYEQGDHSPEEFLHCFHQVRKQLNKTRFLFGASSSIESYLKSRNLGEYFSDCEPVRLSFFSEDISRLFIESLLYGMGIYPSLEVIKAILKLSFPTVPYFTQVFIGQIAAFHRRMKRAPNEAEVAQIYEYEVTDHDCRRYFDQFVDRIECLRENKKAVLNLLSVLAENKEGLDITTAMMHLQKDGTKNEEIDKTFSYLEFDFYIEHTNDRIKFANPILRDYWKKNR